MKKLWALLRIIIHTSLFFDEIKVRNCFLQRVFVQWNAISLAYLHSVRVLRLSANVQFACNNVRLFNAGEISLQHSLRFFDIRMRRNSGSSALSAFDCEEAFVHCYVMNHVYNHDRATSQNHAHFLRIRADTYNVYMYTLHCYHAYCIVTSVGFQKSCFCDLK